MSEREKDGKSSINWGGLCKGLLAGAAVVVGFALVCPGTTGNIIQGISSFGKNVDANGIGSALKGLFPGTGSGAPSEGNWMSSSIGWLVKMAAGITAMVMGGSYLLSDKKNSHEAERAQHHHEAKESFALREDMRKMQAVMVARMQASGQDVAAPQMGR